MKKIIILISSYLVACSLHAAQIKYVITPLTQHVFDLPYNGTTQVQYQVTSNAPTRSTLTMEPITGVTQITGGAGVCNVQFTLAKGASCTLQLNIIGSQLTHTILDGPIICEAEDNGTPSAFSCSRPSKANALHVTPMPAADATLQVTNSPLTLTPNGQPGSITVTNTSTSVIAHNITSNFTNTALAGAVNLTANTCSSVMPQNSCTLTYTPTSTAVTLTTFPIQGTNTSTVNAQISSTNFAYVVNSTGSTPVSKCLINPSDAKLFDCQNSGATLASSPYGIVINSTKTIAYITSSTTNQVIMCQISQTDGQLSNCQDSGAGTIFNNDKGITLNSTGLHAYITDTIHVTKCDVSTIDGSFSNCSQTALVQGFGIIIDPLDAYAYIGTNGNSVYKCTVSSIDGTLSTCINASTTSFDAPWGITLNHNGTLAFTANTGNSSLSAGSVSICNVDNLHSLNPCVTYYDPINFSFPTSIILNNTGTKAYISNRDNNTISICDVDQISTPPTITSCENSGATSLSAPVSVEFYS